MEEEDADWSDAGGDDDDAAAADDDDDDDDEVEAEEENEKDTWESSSIATAPCVHQLDSPKTLKNAGDFRVFFLPGIFESALKIKYEHTKKNNLCKKTNNTCEIPANPLVFTWNLYKFRLLFLRWSLLVTKLATITNLPLHWPGGHKLWWTSNQNLNSTLGQEVTTCCEKACGA